MNHGYKTQQELQEAQAQGKKFMFDGSTGNLLYVEKIK